MHQISDFYKFSRLGNFLKKILKVELLFYHNNGKNQKENYIDETKTGNNTGKEKNK